MKDIVECSPLAMMWGKRIPVAVAGYGLAFLRAQPTGGLGLIFICRASRTVSGAPPLGDSLALCSQGLRPFSMRFTGSLDSRRRLPHLDRPSCKSRGPHPTGPLGGGYAQRIPNLQCAYPSWFIEDLDYVRIHPITLVLQLIPT